jgi:hypothetical protein
LAAIPGRSLPPRVRERQPALFHVELDDGSRFGPFGVGELRALADDGRLDRTDQIVGPDGARKPASSVPGVFLT